MPNTLTILFTFPGACKFPKEKNPTADLHNSCIYPRFLFFLKLKLETVIVKDKADLEGNFLRFHMR